MKTKAAFVLLLIAAVLLFCACSAEDKTNLNDLMTDINAEFSLKELSSVSTKDELHTLYQINENCVEDYCAEYSADSDIRLELIIVRAKDDDSIYAVKTALFNRLDSFRQNSKSYSPDEYAMLEKCSVKVYDDRIVTLIICDSAQEIDSYIDSKLS